MTDRLYYTDPYLREFDATVARVDPRDHQLLVTLDRTAFYPTSGGQPFDTGRLGSFSVVDVIDEGDGSIVHVVEPAVRALESGAEPGPQTALEAGQRLRADIDWPRRFDHMQQHSGQHVLSAAFDKLFGVRTVSFHLGGAVSTIDLAREMSPAEITAAEAEANRVVWEDRPVLVRFADAEEAARLPLRKESMRSGTLRLIEIERFDLSACGGTHVARTGGIGVIAVSSWERFKSGQRLEFVCGGRALDAYRGLRDSMSASVRLLSVLPAELPGAIERLQAEARDYKRTMAGMQNELAQYQAEQFAARAEEITLKPGETAVAQRCRLVARVIDADANGLKTLASAIVAQPGFLVVLTSGSPPGLVLIARSADVAVSADRLLKRLIAEFGGRGGGRSELAQAGGLATPPESIFGFLRSLV